VPPPLAACTSPPLDALHSRISCSGAVLALQEFGQAWKAATQAVGLTGKLFDDFPRTAVRDMVRAGIPERVAQQISGHKTGSAFDRYRIVSDIDLQETARRQA
jgi:integrase